MAEVIQLIDSSEMNLCCQIQIQLLKPAVNVTSTADAPLPVYRQIFAGVQESGHRLLYIAAAACTKWDNQLA